jgi:hypothetical protein
MDMRIASMFLLTEDALNAFGMEAAAYIHGR